MLGQLTTQRSKSSTRFRKENAPAPEPFYRGECKCVGRANSQGWITATCIFQKRDRHPSLRLNLRTGAYHCFACGAHGGDIIDFVMQRDGLTFKQAAIALGAWDRHALTPVEREQLREAQRAREQKKADDFRFQRALRDLRIQYRAEVHTFDGMVQAMRRRIDDADTTPLEREAAGDVLQLALSELRESLAAYYLLSFGSERTRKRFVLEPGSRNELIAEVWITGAVVDDEDKRMEVAL